MSYVLTASSTISTPIAISDGGTGATTALTGAQNLVNGATGQDSIKTLQLFATMPVPPPASPDPADLEASLQELIGVLNDMGVITV